jgi:hypothetical protein
MSPAWTSAQARPNLLSFSPVVKTVGVFGPSLGPSLLVGKRIPNFAWSIWVEALKYELVRLASSLIESGDVFGTEEARSGAVEFRSC